MKIISTESLPKAQLIARRLGLPPTAYIYVPDNDQAARKERLRGLYGFSYRDLVGDFSYEEITRVCRHIG